MSEEGLGMRATCAATHSASRHGTPGLAREAWPSRLIMLQIELSLKGSRLLPVPLKMRFEEPEVLVKPA